MTHLGEAYTPINRWNDLETYKQRIQVGGEVFAHYQTLSAAYSIRSTSNTTPVVVVTNDNNQFETGDAVLIVETGDAGADNDIPWAITRIDNVSFSLDTSTAGGGSLGLGRAVEMSAGNIATLIDNVQYLGQHLLGRDVWARVQTSGAGAGASVVAGEGVASAAVVAVGGDYMIDVTLSAAYANANIAPVVSSLDGGVGYSASVEYSACTASNVRVAVYDSSGTIVDVSSTVARIAIHVRGPK